MKIAVDAMGGDVGCKVTVPASLNALEYHKDLELVLVGDQEAIERVLKEDDRYKNNDEIIKRLSIKHASQQILMDESPSRALRSKKDSSMRVAINLVANHEAEACVSSGNTGALVAISRFVLRMIPGVSRPAITTHFPALNKKIGTNVLDLGATIEAKAKDLVELAVMGSVLASVVDKVEQPKVALLNIGTEEIKGNEQIKEAANLLANNPHINYVGFIEGNELFKGEVDVVVCDGFTGNVVLKTIEGAMKLVAALLKKSVLSSIITKVCAFLALPLFKRLYRNLEPNKYNGASLVGLNGIVVKSHGGADINGFTHSISKAMLEVENKVPQRIRSKVEEIMRDANEKDFQNEEL